MQERNQNWPMPRAAGLGSASCGSGPLYLLNSYNFSMELCGLLVLEIRPCTDDLLSETNLFVLQNMNLFLLQDMIIKVYNDILCQEFREGKQ